MSTTGKELVQKINLNRCTEDTYLEVKELRDEWLKSENSKEEEKSKEVQESEESGQLVRSNVAMLDLLLKALELKFDDSESE